MGRDLVEHGIRADHLAHELPPGSRGAHRRSSALPASLPGRSPHGRRPSPMLSAALQDGPHGRQGPPACACRIRPARGGPGQQHPLVLVEPMSTPSTAPPAPRRRAGKAHFHGGRRAPTGARTRPPGSRRSPGRKTGSGEEGMKVAPAGRAGSRLGAGLLPAAPAQFQQDSAIAPYRWGVRRRPGAAQQGFQCAARQVARHPAGEHHRRPQARATVSRCCGPGPGTTRRRSPPGCSRGLGVAQVGLGEHGTAEAMGGGLPRLDWAARLARRCRPGQAPGLLVQEAARAAAQEELVRRLRKLPSPESETG